MSSVPITFHGMMYPKDKSVKPYAFTALGTAEITGLGVGGGPIVPPDEIGDIPKPPGDWVIWGGADQPFPTPPIHLPPTLPPVDPPNPPEPPHEGWNWSQAKAGWYYLYVPGEGEAGPKRGRR
jgi:hypothetical protein